MKLFNTMSRKIDELKPLHGKEVKIYSCGPTVYDRQHIGNMSAYIYWDVLVRALLLDGYDVKRLINITDVGHLVSDADEGEDKLEKGARREGKSAWEIADFYMQAYLNDFKKLNLIAPMDFPRATDHIPTQLELVRRLKALGLTYQINDGIYLDTSKIKDYGRLTRLDLDKLKAGARVEFNKEKRNITDFAVWKFSNGIKREMQWETPQDLLENKTDGPVMGFPGWHMECSAIILDMLGEQIDIHTGGIDHIPVHHTNEIAQMEPITGKELSQIWSHNNHLKIDGTKISKSLGNTYNLDQLAERGFTPMDFKMFVLQSHYQTEGNFSFESLQAAKNRLDKWYKIAVLRHQINDGLVDDNEKTFNFLAIKHHILELANENLDTPQILREIDLVFDKILNPKLDLSIINRKSFIEFLEQIDALLGFDLINKTPDISDNMKRLIQARQIAREQKNWAKSDEIRDELKAQKILLDDRQARSYWYYQF